MRLVTRLAIFSLASIASALGQLPDLAKPPEPAQETVPVTDPAKRLEKPLTPAELREQQIRMRDPLSKTDPIMGDRNGNESGLAPAPLVRPQPTAPPLPGSIAESDLVNSAGRRGTGPDVVSEARDESSQEYSGPSVLSRSYTISRPNLPQSIKWTPRFGFTESYDTGLTQPSLSPGGPLRSGSASGYGLSWALSGQHAWKRDLLLLDYHGDVTRYGSNAAYNGTNQSLNLSVRHIISRHLFLNFSSAASSLSRNSLLTNALGNPGNSVANTNLSTTPATRFYDSGIRQWTNQLGVTWQKSSRLSLTASGGVFLLGSAGVNGIGSSGLQAQSDINYRITRKTTVGVYYSFTNYTYSHHLNVANFHTIGGIYSYAVNRGLQIRLRAGVSAIENEGQQVVRIDPEIAALLGQAQGIVQVYSRSLISDISAQIVKDLGHRRTANLSYARGISPGNGSLQTSVQENYTASYSMVVFRSYLLDLGTGQTSLSSAAQNGAQYKSSFIGGGVSRNYGRGMNGSLRLDYRKFNVPGQPNLTSQIRISTTISWSPSQNWLR